MMMNLFSSFNPSSWSALSMNWVIMIMMPMIMLNKYWTIKSKMFTAQKVVIINMYLQFKTLMSKSMKMNILIMMSIMISIMLWNTSSLYPYIYAPTAMPQTCMPLALSMWMGINMKKSVKTTKMLSNFLPKNTPKPLIPAMILIESISLIIQPITLSVRLMANITAGHILMILISSSYNMKMAGLIMMIQLMLSIMEVCVAFIQAYVFSMLLIMFNK